MRADLILCQSTILTEIAQPESTERDVSQTYRLCLESSERDTIEWGTVNAAIIARWSKTALMRIKKAAHSGKCFAVAT